MEHIHVDSLPVESADPAHFTGRTTLKRMMNVARDPAVSVYWVEFEPRARTDWHTHSGPQLLLIVDGVCRYQIWGNPVREATAGDLISIAANEKHWHGAGPAARMVHAAFNLNATTAWLERVTDDQYDGQAT